MLREEAKQNMFEERAIRDERVSMFSSISFYKSLLYSFCFLDACVIVDQK